MINRTKALLAGAAVTTAVAFGALGTAAAQEETPTPTPAPDQERQAPERGDRSRDDCPEPGSGGESGSADAGFGSDAVAY